MFHRDQWKAIFETEGLAERFLHKLLEAGSLVAQYNVELPGEDGIGRTEEGFALAYPATPLRYLALCATNSSGSELTRELQAAFPWCAEGIESEFEIESVLPDAEDPMEGGLVVATSFGGLLWLVDPLFFTNRHRYARGKKLRFAVAALAYSLALASTDYVEITGGGLLELERNRARERDPNADVSAIKSVRLWVKGSHYLFPDLKLPLLSSGYRVPVERVEELTVEGRRFVRVLISPFVCEDESESVGMWLYASPTVLQGYTPRVGDEIEGQAWIQGTLV